MHECVQNLNLIINKANEMSLTRTDIKTFEKMVIRSMFGNINASRNSA